MMSTLVLGGCRSGKSRHALTLADQIKGKSKIFIATSVPLDEEMHQRVSAHQAERGPDWLTAEEPVRIADLIRDRSKDADVILVDCLTLWISNMMFEGYDDPQIRESTTAFTDSIRTASCPVIAVSNEVGTGVVPENSLSRRFRDNAGFVNQAVAAAVDEVFWCVAGIPVAIKKTAR